MKKNNNNITQEELREKKRILERILEKYSLKIQDIKTREREILERVIAEDDKEKIEKILKSLK
jgi:hypothetical protein